MQSFVAHYHSIVLSPKPKYGPWEDGIVKACRGQVPEQGEDPGTRVEAKSLRVTCVVGAELRWIRGWGCRVHYWWRNTIQSMNAVIRIHCQVAFQWPGFGKGNDAELCLSMLLSSLIVGRCSDNVAQAPFSQILPHIADSSKYPKLLATQLLPFHPPLRSFPSLSLSLLSHPTQSTPPFHSRVHTLIDSVEYSPIPSIVRD
jgi:hypothetical protein